LKCGVGKALFDFSIEHSIKSQVKSIRLDVNEGNIPSLGYMKNVVSNILIQLTWDLETTG